MVNPQRVTTGATRRTRRRNPLPPGFADRLRAHIAKGLSAKDAMRLTWQQMKRKRKTSTANPLGEELMVIGALNPRRKEVKSMTKNVKRHRVRARRNPVNPYRPRRRHRRNPLVHINRSHRRHRRNPVRGRVAIMKPGTWIPYVLTAGASATLTAAAPRLFFGSTVTPTMAYLTQAGVGVAGGVILPMVVDPIHGLVWLVVSGGIILADTIGRYALSALGLSAYPGYGAAPVAPYYPPRLSGVEEYPFRNAALGGGEAMGNFGAEIPDAPWIHAS